MNCFVEGLQGSGKSTLVQKIQQNNPGYTAIREGDYSPVELSWCAYIDETKYGEILEKYAAIKDLIEKKTFIEDDKRIVCYTQIITDIPDFHKDLEQYEIYNGRTANDVFQSLILKRYRKWNGDNMIFECSLFQNIVEDMILFRCASDEEIIHFYRLIAEALDGKDYQIIYLKTEDIKGNLDVIRKERSDEEGNELWYPLMMSFFNHSPFAQRNYLQGEDDLIRHFQHRQELELRICREVFSEKFTVLNTKNYKDEDIALSVIN